MTLYILITPTCKSAGLVTLGLPTYFSISLSERSLEHSWCRWCQHLKAHLFSIVAFKGVKILYIQLKLASLGHRKGTGVVTYEQQ